jgi:hypothetical protein
LQKRKWSQQANTVLEIPQEMHAARRERDLTRTTGIGVDPGRVCNRLACPERKEQDGRVVREDSDGRMAEW